MECGKLTAKLRDAVQVIFIEEGREPKRFKNIEIPDEIKAIDYKDFKFDVQDNGQINFKIWFEQGALPAEWPEARERRHRIKENVAESAAEPVTESVKESEAPAPVVEETKMEINYNVTGDRRKELVATIAEKLNEKPKYMNLPTQAYRIGEYEISKTGTMTGPTNEELTTWIKDHGFDAE